MQEKIWPELFSVVAGVTALPMIMNTFNEGTITTATATTMTTISAIAKTTMIIMISVLMIKMKTL